MADAMKLSEVIETLEALTKSPGADEFDKGARAARLDALDMLRPLAASPPAREEAPAEGAGEIEDILIDCFEPKAYGIPRANVASAVKRILALRNRTSEPEAGAVVAGLREAVVELRDGLVASRKDIGVDDWIELCDAALSRADVILRGEV